MASTTDLDSTIQPVEPECKVVDGHQPEVVHGEITGDNGDDDDDLLLGVDGIDQNLHSQAAEAGICPDSQAVAEAGVETLTHHRQFQETIL